MALGRSSRKPIHSQRLRSLDRRFMFGGLMDKEESHEAAGVMKFLGLFNNIFSMSFKGLIVDIGTSAKRQMR